MPADTPDFLARLDALLGQGRNPRSSLAYQAGEKFRIWNPSLNKWQWIQPSTTSAELFYDPTKLNFGLDPRQYPGLGRVVRGRTLGEQEEMAARAFRESGYAEAQQSAEAQSPRHPGVQEEAPIQGRLGEPVPAGGMGRPASGVGTWSIYDRATGEERLTGFRHLRDAERHLQNTNLDWEGMTGPGGADPFLARSMANQPPEGMPPQGFGANTPPSLMPVNLRYDETPGDGSGVFTFADNSSVPYHAVAPAQRRQFMDSLGPETPTGGEQGGMIRMAQGGGRPGYPQYGPGPGPFGMTDEEMARRSAEFHEGIAANRNNPDWMRDNSRQIARDIRENQAVQPNYSWRTNEESERLRGTFREAIPRNEGEGLQAYLERLYGGEEGAGRAAHDNQQIFANTQQRLAQQSAETQIAHIPGASLAETENALGTTPQPVNAPLSPGELGASPGLNRLFGTEPTGELADIDEGWWANSARNSMQNINQMSLDAAQAQHAARSGVGGLAEGMAAEASPVGAVAAEPGLWAGFRAGFTPSGIRAYLGNAPRNSGGFTNALEAGADWQVASQFNKGTSLALAIPGSLAAAFGPKLINSYAPLPTPAKDLLGNIVAGAGVGSTGFALGPEVGIPTTLIGAGIGGFKGLMEDIFPKTPIIPFF